MMKTAVHPHDVNPEEKRGSSGTFSGMHEYKVADEVRMRVESEDSPVGKASC